MTTERKTATELFDRYMGRTGVGDARFRAIVDLLVAHMLDQKIAPDEIRDAAFVASIKYLQINPVREIVYERDDIRWPDRV